MAKNITLMGANYPDVPAVVLPKTGGGSAMFVDADVVSWKTAGDDVGTNTVTVPATWGEVNVIVMIDGAQNRCFSFRIPRGRIWHGTYNFRDGYYAHSGNNAYVEIQFVFNNDDTVTVSVTNATLTGTDYLSTTTFYVQYKDR